jgi:hypothetical protein
MAARGSKSGVENGLVVVVTSVFKWVAKSETHHHMKAFTDKILVPFAKISGIS